MIPPVWIGNIMLGVFVGGTYIGLAVLTTPLTALIAFYFIAFATLWLTIAFCLMRDK